MLSTIDLYNPWRELDNVFFGKNWVAETDESASKFELEVPGVKRDNIKVKLEGGYLRVDWKDRHGSQHRATRRVGRANGIDLDLKDGVLTMEIKRPEEFKAEVRWMDKVT